MISGEWEISRVWQPVIGSPTANTQEQSAVHHNLIHQNCFMFYGKVNVWKTHPCATVKMVGGIHLLGGRSLDFSTWLVPTVFWWVFGRERLNCQTMTVGSSLLPVSKAQCFAFSWEWYVKIEKSHLNVDARRTAGICRKLCMSGRRNLQEVAGRICTLQICPKLICSWNLHFIEHLTNAQPFQHLGAQQSGFSFTKNRENKQPQNRNC